MNAGIDTRESSMNTKEIIDRIFKDPGTKHKLTELSIQREIRRLHEQALIAQSSQGNSSTKPNPASSNLSTKRRRHER